MVTTIEQSRHLIEANKSNGVLNWNNMTNEEKTNFLYRLSHREKVKVAVAEVEEKAKAFTEANNGKSAEEILAEMRGEEPVSDDLEEEMDNWIDNNIAPNARGMYESFMKICARHFANWQREHMIKYSMECRVQVNGMSERYLVMERNPIIHDNTLNDGERVKLIIIKED